MLELDSFDVNNAAELDDALELGDEDKNAEDEEDAKEATKDTGEDANEGADEIVERNDAGVAREDAAFCTCSVCIMAVPLQ